jgi:hypothetical protein
VRHPTTKIIPRVLVTCNAIIVRILWKPAPGCNVVEKFDDVNCPGVVIDAPQRVGQRIRYGTDIRAECGGNCKNKFRAFPATRWGRKWKTPSGRCHDSLSISNAKAPG